MTVTKPMNAGSPLRITGPLALVLLMAALLLATSVARSDLMIRVT